MILKVIKYGSLPLIAIILFFFCCTDNTTYYTDEANNDSVSIKLDETNSINIEFPKFHNDYVNMPESYLIDKHYASTIVFILSNRKCINKIYISFNNREGKPLRSNIAIKKNEHEYMLSSGFAILSYIHSYGFTDNYSNSILDCFYFFDNNVLTSNIIMIIDIDYSSNCKSYTIHRVIKLNKHYSRSLFPFTGA